MIGMREVLFRGKQRDGEKWKFGYFCSFKGSADIFVPFTEEEEKANEGHIFSVVGGLWYSVRSETVGQFTGLTDKNGKKIFEGDILRAKVYETEIEDSPVFGRNKIRTGNKIDAVWTVEYKNFNASCGYFIYGKDRRFNRLLTYSVIFNNECEVIGNVYDNPDLLEADNG